MTAKFVFLGNINNWMGFRDMLIKRLENCDNELKLSRFLSALILAVSANTKTINETRKDAGLKELSKRELKDIKEGLKI